MQQVLGAVLRWPGLSATPSLTTEEGLAKKEAGPEEPSDNTAFSSSDDDDSGVLNIENDAAVPPSLGIAAQEAVRRSGIMIVPRQQDALTTRVYDDLVKAHRERRALRYQSQGLPASGVRVRFASLTIRKFPVTCGDNPACTTGPPLALTWEPLETVTLAVEEYETARPARRSPQEMVIPLAVRRAILRRGGLSPGDLVRLTRPVNIARRRRRYTRETRHLDSAQEALERLWRASRHVATLYSRKRQERQLLEPYMSAKQSPAPATIEASIRCSWTAALKAIDNSDADVVLDTVVPHKRALDMSPKRTWAMRLETVDAADRL